MCRISYLRLASTYEFICKLFNYRIKTRYSRTRLVMYGTPQIRVSAPSSWNSRPDETWQIRDSPLSNIGSASYVHRTGLWWLEHSPGRNQDRSFAGIVIWPNGSGDHHCTILRLTATTTLNGDGSLLYQFKARLRPPWEIEFIRVRMAKRCEDSPKFLMVDIWPKLADIPQKFR
jgi:hypothetical protein